MTKIISIKMIKITLKKMIKIILKERIKIMTIKIILKDLIKIIPIDRIKIIIRGMIEMIEIKNNIRILIIDPIRNIIIKNILKSKEIYNIRRNNIGIKTMSKNMNSMFLSNNMIKNIMRQMIYKIYNQSKSQQFQLQQNSKNPK